VNKEKATGNIATRNFNDAGTGKAFEKGKPVDASEGELENYRAAGLVGSQADVQTTTKETPAKTA
jgi:hypothetical protein